MLPVNFSRYHAEWGNHISFIHSSNLSFTYIQTRPCCLLPKLRMAPKQCRWLCITPRLLESSRWDGGSPQWRLIFWKNIFKPQKSVIEDTDCSEQHSRNNFPVRRDEDFLGLGRKGHQGKKYKHKRRYLFGCFQIGIIPTWVCVNHTMLFIEIVRKETHEPCFTPVGRRHR